MSATRDLIAAALTAAGSIRWQYPELADDMRELCARAMVQPDMGEVKNLVSAACNLMFDAGKLLGRRDAGADREVEDARSARTALLDYVRGVMAERDALIHDNKRLMQIAAQEVSAAPQPVGEFCTDYHCPGDCGLNGHGYQHAPQPVGAAEMSMPELNDDGYDLIDRFLRNNLDDDDYAEYMSGLQQYGDAREAAGYAAGVTSGAKQMFDYIQFAAANTSDTEWDTQLCELSQDALEAVSPVAHAEWKTIQRAASESRTAGEAAGYARGLAEAWSRVMTSSFPQSSDEAHIKKLALQAIDAALRGEVKP